MNNGIYIIFPFHLNSRIASYALLNAETENICTISTYFSSEIITAVLNLILLSKQPKSFNLLLLLKLLYKLAHLNY